MKRYFCWVKDDVKREEGSSQRATIKESSFRKGGEMAKGSETAGETSVKQSDTE